MFSKIYTEYNLVVFLFSKNVKKGPVAETNNNEIHDLNLSASHRFPPVVFGFLKLHRYMEIDFLEVLEQQQKS